MASPSIKRLSIDCKATVAIGDVSRRGLTRGDHRACEHDLGWHEQYMPCGIVEKDSARLRITFGSSFTTSNFIVDALEAWWATVDETGQAAMTRLQITMDNGPESSGKRTQFLHHMVQFADQIGKPIHLLYYPPYQSKYNPSERCRGILELHWNGTKLVDVKTMLEWAKSMTWQDLHPIVELSCKGYQKGIVLSKKAIPAIESRLERHPELPKWDILIRLASAL
jgi:hypothetical protein